MQGGCGTNPVQVNQIPEISDNLLKPCPEELPKAKSGKFVDLWENHNQITEIYHRECKEPHNKLVKLLKRLKEEGK